MSTIALEAQKDIAIVQLDNGVTNAVSRALVEDLSDALEKVKSEFSGMVLAGGTKFFSIGLNVPELLELNRQEMTEFWHRFNRVCFDIFTLPVPTTCALAGHAPGAGAIFALACDFRFAAAGEKLVGFNEISLGIPVPYLADMMLRQVVGDRVATNMMYRGKLMTPEKAKETGLIDMVLESDELEDKAIKNTAEIAIFDSQALSAIKANRVEEICLKFEKNHKEKHEMFIDCWFSKPVQKLLHKAVEKF
jgi:enoyl-CoA hydratase/carnithine racemase